MLVVGTCRVEKGGQSIKAQRQGAATMMSGSERQRIVDQMAETMASGRPQLADNPEFPNFITAWRDRIGETPAQRLEWVLGFLKKDLTRLLPGERAALGWGLRVIAIFSLRMGAGARGGLRTSLRPMSDEALAGYQREVREGLRGLLSSEMTAWRLPAEPALSRKARAPGFEYLFLGDERAGVLGGIANLVLEAGDRLRACRQCGDPFVAKENRQHYCAPACSQRARNQRRKPRRAKLRKRGR
jgi:hypothetical protein